MNRPQRAGAWDIGLIVLSLWLLCPSGKLANAEDCNNNGIEDICDIDCDAPGCTDPCGESDDCNGNGIPDECDIAAGEGITEIINEGGDGAGNGLDGAHGTAVDAVDAAGNVYVTGFVSDNAFKITPPGVITEIINTTGDGAGNVFDAARGITVDAAGNVYVAGFASDNAFKITLAASLDCNANGIPDECDIAEGTSDDDNDNGVPDECDSGLCGGDKEWALPVDGDWHDPGAWTPPGVPGPADTVCISGGVSFIVTASLSIQIESLAIGNTGVGTSTTLALSTQLEAQEGINILPGGVITGFGTISTDIVSSGTILADDGVLLLAGAYTHQAGARLGCFGDAQLHFGDGIGDDTISTSGNDIEFPIPESLPGTAVYRTASNAPIATSGGDIVLYPGHFGGVNSDIECCFAGTIATTGGSIRTGDAYLEDLTITFAADVDTDGGDLDFRFSALSTIVRFEGIVDAGVGALSITSQCGGVDCGITLEILNDFHSGGVLIGDLIEFPKTWFVFGDEAGDTIIIDGSFSIQNNDFLRSFQSAAEIIAETVFLQLGAQLGAGTQTTFASAGLTVQGSATFRLNDLEMQVGSNGPIAIGDTLALHGFDDVNRFIFSAVGNTTAHALVYTTEPIGPAIFAVGVMTVQEQVHIGANQLLKERPHLDISGEFRLVNGPLDAVGAVITGAGTMILETAATGELIAVVIVSAILNNGSLIVDLDPVCPPPCTSAMVGELLNNGEIEVLAEGQILTVGSSDTKAVNNDVLRSADGSTLQIAGPLVQSQAGVIEAENGGIVLISADVMGDGELRASGGTIIINDPTPGFGPAVFTRLVEITASEAQAAQVQLCIADLNVLTDLNVDVTPGVNGARLDGAAGVPLFGGCDPPPPASIVQLAIRDGSTLDVGGSLIFTGPVGVEVFPATDVLLAGNFDNGSTAPDAFDWGDGPLTMNSDGDLQTIEAAGVDLGPEPAGLENNFALGTLTLTADTTVTVVDLRDNQQDGPEDLRSAVRRHARA